MGTGIGWWGREAPRPAAQYGASRGSALMSVSLCLSLISLSLFAFPYPTFLGLSVFHTLCPSVFLWSAFLSPSLPLYFPLSPCSSVPSTLSVHPDVSLVSICPCLWRSPLISVLPILSLTPHLPLSDVSPHRKHCLSQSWWAAAPLPSTQVSRLRILLGPGGGLGRKSQAWGWAD